MSKEKDLINRITFLNHHNNDEVIFDTYNSYEIIEIVLPSRSIIIGEEFIVHEIKYKVEEITIDVLSPESEILKNNLQTIIYVSKVI